jgi:hypothetical protein
MWTCGFKCNFYFPLFKHNFSLLFSVRRVMMLVHLYLMQRLRMRNSYLYVTQTPSRHGTQIRGTLYLWPSRCSYGVSETIYLNCDHQRAYCSSPNWYMSIESPGGMILTGENEELGEKPVLVILCPPQIPHRLTGREPGPARWKAGD